MDNDIIMPNIKKCIFCSIVLGESNSSKVYEDNNILAFMDNRPIHKGQVVVIPKKHTDNFLDLPDDLAINIFLRAHRISRIVKNKLNPKTVGLVVHGYDVRHAHMMVVPQHDKDDIVSGELAHIKDGRIVFNMSSMPIESKKELDQIAKLLKSD